MPIIAIRLEGEDREAATEIDPDMPVHRLGLTTHNTLQVSRTPAGPVLSLDDRLALAVAALAVGPPESRPIHQAIACSI
jgi:hypothetical protein